MNILISGASGLIGTALKNSLLSKGHTVYPLVRKNIPGEPFYWLPAEDMIHLDETIHIDTVINLAGENIADGRWNADKKNNILNSRVNSTRLLSSALAGLKNRPSLYISGSAIGFYGDTKDRSVDESSSPGSDFLSDVAIKWEQATRTAQDAGIRTVHIRTGVVLSPLGGVLQKIVPPFKMGLGGIIGNGQQYMSWVSLREVISMIQFIIENEMISGPVNLVSKNPVTNADFTKTLGKVLNRPTLIPLPATVARVMFGEMADALLLSGTRVMPSKLKTAGYKYIDEDLESTLRSLLKR